MQWFVNFFQKIITVVQSIFVQLMHHKFVSLHCIYTNWARFGMLYATLVKYFCDIPPSDSATFLGLPVSGRILTYSIALQVSKLVQSDSKSDKWSSQWIFFRLLYSNCLNWKFTAMIIYHSHIHRQFIYESFHIHYIISLLSRENMNSQLTSLPMCGFNSLVGRASHQLSTEEHWNSLRRSFITLNLTSCYIINILLRK